MSLTSYLLAAIATLPTFHEDVGAELVARKQAQAEVIAQAISDVAESAEGWSGSKRELATLLLTVAWHETRFSLRIHEGKCKPYECDHGRARSLWQLHVHPSLPRDLWLQLAGVDVESTRRAAREAAKALSRSRNMCAGRARGSELVGQTLSAYAGRGCARLLPDVDARVRTYRRLLAIQPKGGAV
ncbi:MAG: hypothetical protein QM756_20790 [Polyangiaceae bacterium]